MKKLWTLFITVFFISACTFGGGFVIIALMKKKFVEELSWIDEQEMLDLTAIGQSAPGPIAVNAAILVGYRVAGVAGIVVGILGTILPPLIIISAIAFAYQAFRDNAYVSMAMTGIMAAVAAVVLDVVINMLTKIIKQKRLLYVITFLFAFIALRFFHVSILYIVLCGIMIGAFDTLVLGKEKKS